MNLPIIGIDIDQEFFVACLLLGKKTQTRKFKNMPSGFRELSAWLCRWDVKVALACMEATGRYGEKLAEYLHAQGHKVAVVNPAFICSHKSTLNKHNKTDPNDADAIADYARCFKTKLRLWEPKNPVHKALIDVVGQMHILKKTITAFSNRGGCGIDSEDVRELNEETLNHLKGQLEKLETLRDKLFDQLPALREVRKILISVPGIGGIIADSLSAKIDFANFRNGRDLSSFLGLGSREWKSGKQKRRGKQTKAGNPLIRSLLRMGAMAVAYGEHSFFKEFADRLRKQGLEEPQILTAVARKIILIAHALVRKNQLFDCCFEHPLAKNAA